MSAKILPALIVGLLLGTTAFAAAQTLPADAYTPVVYRGMQYYWVDPYYGTPFENVAPYSAYGMPDPYRGTVWDDVAPY